MRPINNVVDVSNYVMLELGQPNHPYDLDRLPGRGLRVRRGPGGRDARHPRRRRAAGSSPDDCLICDAEDTPVGIAGVMGGASSEIADATTEVLLEAAWFDARWPSPARRSGSSLRTEASARFERGTDPEAIDRAVARFCELLGADRRRGRARRRRRARHLPDRRRRWCGPDARVNALLGTELTRRATIGGYLEPIGFAADRRRARACTTSPCPTGGPTRPPRST